MVVAGALVPLHLGDVSVQRLDQVAVAPFVDGKAQFDRCEHDRRAVHRMRCFVQDAGYVGGYAGIGPPCLHRLEHIRDLVHLDQVHLDLELPDEIQESGGVDAPLKTGYRLPLQVHDGVDAGALGLVHHPPVQHQELLGEVHELGARLGIADTDNQVDLAVFQVVHDTLPGAVHVMHLPPFPLGHLVQHLDEEPLGGAARVRIDQGLEVIDAGPDDSFGSCMVGGNQKG